jgi:hypothetical protein
VVFLLLFCIAGQILTGHTQHLVPHLMQLSRTFYLLVLLLLLLLLLQLPLLQEPLLTEGASEG